MVQGKGRGKGSLRSTSRSGKPRPKGQAMTQRKAVPNIHRPSNPTTSAINRRNEQLMAGRLAHEGGTLAIIPRPDRVERYEKGGAGKTEKQVKQLFHSSMTRHSRMKRDGMQVGEVGEKAGGGRGGEVGKKRKRGMEGITHVGDEWFDEADKPLEDLRFHSEEEEDGEEAASSSPPPNSTAGDEEKRVEDETAAEVGVGTDIPSTVVHAVDGALERVVAKAKSAKKAEVSAAMAVEEVGGDEVEQATKRAKALLGGWFTSRSQREDRRRKANKG